MPFGKLMLLAAGAVVLILVIGLIAMRDVSIETRAELRIAAPPVVVWEAIANPDLRARWMENVSSAARMTGMAGEQGSTMMLRVEVDEFKISVFEEVVGSQFPDFIRTETTDNQGELSVSTAYFIEPGDPGTDLSVVVIRDLGDSLASFFAPFIAMRSQSTLEEDLERLRRIVEQDPI